MGSLGPLLFYVFSRESEGFSFKKNFFFLLLSNNFLHILTFKAAGFMKRYQAKLLLYLLSLLSPGEWEVQPTPPSSLLHIWRKTILIRICGEINSQGWCRPLFLRISCSVWLIFFLSWPHAQNLGFGHTQKVIPGSGLRLRTSVYIHLVPLSGEKYSSGCHLGHWNQEGHSLLASDRRCCYVTCLY